LFVDVQRFLHTRYRAIADECMCMVKSASSICVNLVRITPPRM
jgi:hypothetical protein